KADVVTHRVDRLATSGSRVVDVVPSDQVDVGRNLGPGETSVLSFALASPSATLCVLDDAAARIEARRLGLALGGTLGIVLGAKTEGRVEAAGPAHRRHAALTRARRVIARSVRPRRVARAGRVADAAC